MKIWTFELTSNHKMHQIRLKTKKELISKKMKLKIKVQNRGSLNWQLHVSVHFPSPLQQEGARWEILSYRPLSDSFQSVPFPF
jgi:hypothetical protein